MDKSKFTFSLLCFSLSAIVLADSQENTPESCLSSRFLETTREEMACCPFSGTSIDYSPYEVATVLREREDDNPQYKIKFDRELGTSQFEQYLQAIKSKKINPEIIIDTPYGKCTLMHYDENKSRIDGLSDCFDKITDQKDREYFIDRLWHSDLLIATAFIQMGIAGKCNMLINTASDGIWRSNKQSCWKINATEREELFADKNSERLTDETAKN